METMYFVLGMLSIIGAFILATIVWGTLKIVNLLKTIKQHEEWMANNERNVYDNMHRLREDLDRRMDNMDRHANSYVTDLQREMEGMDRNVHKRIDNELNDVHMRIEHTHRDMDTAINDQITDAVTQSNSYTDKRIDKLIDTYFIASEAKKQVIKG